ncbi:hypothetical protein CBL_06739 [Carabus blaptoides fortunei]
MGLLDTLRAHTRTMLRMQANERKYITPPFLHMKISLNLICSVFLHFARATNTKSTCYYGCKVDILYLFHTTMHEKLWIESMFACSTRFWSTYQTKAGIAVPPMRNILPLKMRPPFTGGTPGGHGVFRKDEKRKCEEVN